MSELFCKSCLFVSIGNNVRRMFSQRLKAVLEGQLWLASDRLASQLKALASNILQKQFSRRLLLVPPVPFPFLKRYDSPQNMFRYAVQVWRFSSKCELQLCVEMRCSLSRSRLGAETSTQFILLTPSHLMTEFLAMIHNFNGIAMDCLFAKCTRRSFCTFFVSFALVHKIATQIK